MIKIRTLSVLAALLMLSAPAFAQSAGPSSNTPLPPALAQDRQQLEQLKSQIQQERAQAKQNHETIEQDRAIMRQDMQNGNMAGAQAEHQQIEQLIASQRALKNEILQQKEEGHQDRAALQAAGFERPHEDTRQWPQAAPPSAPLAGGPPTNLPPVAPPQ